MAARPQSRRFYDKVFEWSSPGADSMEELSYSNKNLHSFTAASPLQDDGVSEDVRLERTRIYAEMKRASVVSRSKSTGALRPRMDALPIGTLAPIESNARAEAARRRAAQPALASVEAAACALDARAEALIAGEAAPGKLSPGTKASRKVKTPSSKARPLDASQEVIDLVQPPMPPSALGKSKSLPVIEGLRELTPPSIPASRLDIIDLSDFDRTPVHDDPEVIEIVSPGHPNHNQAFGDMFAAKSLKKSKRIQEAFAPNPQDVASARLDGSRAWDEQAEASESVKPLGAKTPPGRRPSRTRPLTTGCMRRGETASIPEDPSWQGYPKKNMQQFLAGQESVKEKIIRQAPERVLEETEDKLISETELAQACSRPMTAGTSKQAKGRLADPNLWNVGFNDNGNDNSGDNSAWDAPKEIYYAWGGDDDDWEALEMKDEDWIFDGPAATPRILGAATPRIFGA